MASAVLRLSRSARCLAQGRRFFAVSSEIKSYGPITEDLRDKYTPLHPTLEVREKDNEGRGLQDRPVETKIMRPNLEFADADPGPLGPKVFHFAKGDVPVVQGAANISAPPDSWVAAENLESEFDKFLPFRKKLAISSGRGPTKAGPLAIEDAGKKEALQ